MKTNLGIYIHVPFCLKKCDYCDFYSITDTNLEEKYIHSLLNEIKYNTNEITSRNISSIYFGGGTPSLLSIGSINKILEEIYKYNVLDNIEITLECNPETLSFEYLKELKTTKINRLSIGMQSMDDIILKQIGRIHNKSKFLESYNLARNLGFNNINIDIMFGFYNQSFLQFQSTLEEVIKIKPSHISCYSLILEEGTKMFNDIKNSKIEETSEDSQIYMYEYMVKFLKENGYNRYEISNFSREGFESRHNMSYWNDTEYLGFGPSASSYINSNRYKNENNVNLYIDNNGINCKTDLEKLTKEDLISEYFFLGLRLDKGVSYKEFFNKFNIEIDKLFKSEIEKLIINGLLIKEDDIIRLTDKGVNLSNYVFESFIL